MTAGSAVLLLHLVLLSAFLFVNYTGTGFNSRAGEIEIRFAPAAPTANPAFPPALQPKFLSPAAPALPPLPGELFAPSQNSMKDDAIGIWHETYLIEPGRFECI